MSIELKDDLPSLSPEKAAAAMLQYQNICKAMLDDSDFQEIKTQSGPKAFKKKSAFRKLARAFQISDEIVKEELIEHKQPDFSVWKIWVKAYTPTRSVIGVGMCSSRESRTFAHLDHDLYATAHTRAKNRAISDLIGSGEVSAEEMEGPMTSTGSKPQANDKWYEAGKK